MTPERVRINPINIRDTDKASYEPKYTRLTLARPERPRFIFKHTRWGIVILVKIPVRVIVLSVDILISGMDPERVKAHFIDLR